MPDQDLIIPERDWRKLLAAASGDSALLYLYLRAGGTELQARHALRMSDDQIAAAASFLRQSGLWEDKVPTVMRPAQPPSYTEADLLRAQERDMFRRLLGEVQRRLGKLLSVEECKILLSIHEYLGMSDEVISILICYCLQRSKAKGNDRTPSMRTIEREAYRWADLGIETMEETASYVQLQNQRQTKIGKVRRTLQLGDRRLTPGEEKYIAQWLDWGFGTDEIAIAYEKTCINTGSLKWPYLNSILKSWHEKGLHDVGAIEAGDKAPIRTASETGGLGELELEAIRRIMQEKKEGM